MSKMSDLIQTLDDLTACGETLIRTATAIREMFKGEPQLTSARDPDLPWDEKPEEEGAPEASAKATYTKEEVRAMLAELAQSGHREEAKALVKKYANGGSLTDIDPASYPELAEEAQKYHA